MNLTDEQYRNAQTILGVGKRYGAARWQLIGAIEAALVESKIRNLAYGDGSSRGIFQQTATNDWGTLAQRMDPVYASTSFFRGHGSNPGILNVGWKGTIGKTVQAVQRSGFPDRYDAWHGTAADIVDTVSPGSGVSIAGFGGVGTILTVGLVGAGIYYVGQGFGWWK